MCLSYDIFKIYLQSILEKSRVGFTGLFLQFCLICVKSMDVNVPRSEIPNINRYYK